MTNTSAKAYQEIVASLSERGRKVFRLPYQYVNVGKMGNPTARELCKFYNLDGGWKRLSELEKKNAVHRGEPRACTITGKVANTWIPGAKPEPETVEEGHLF